MIAPWVNQYIGIPFKEHGRDRYGCDCWGLVRLVYKEQFNIDLPSYSECYDSLVDRQQRADAIETHRLDSEWRHCGEDLPIGAVMLVAVNNLPLHVGLHIGDHNMLHTLASWGKAKRERWDGKKYEHHILGFYQHAEFSH